MWGETGKRKIKSESELNPSQVGEEKNLEKSMGETVRPQLRPFLSPQSLDHVMPNKTRK